MDELGEKLKSVFSFGKKKFKGSGQKLGTAAESPHIRVNRGQARAPDPARAAELSQKLAAARQHQPLHSQEAGTGFDPFKASTVTGNAFTSAVHNQSNQSSPRPSTQPPPASKPPLGVPAAGSSAGSLSQTPPLATPAIQGYEVDDADIDAMQQQLVMVASSEGSMQSLQTLQKILSNILKAPSEAKFRQVRMTNPRIRQAIVDVPGALEFMAACGFEVTFVKGADGVEEGVVVFPEDGNLPHLQEGLQIIQLVQGGAAAQPTQKSPSSQPVPPTTTTAPSSSVHAPPSTAADTRTTAAEPAAAASPVVTAAGIAAAPSVAPGNALADASIGPGIATSPTSIGAANAIPQGNTLGGAGASAAGLGVSSSTGSSNAVSGALIGSGGAAGREVSPVDRDTKVVLPVTPDTRLPDWFFDRTPTDLKGEYAAAMKKREQSSVLTTRAYKEKLAAATAGPKPTHALIRIRFPEGVHLQGRFGANEPVNAVHSWLESCLRNAGGLEYELVDHNRKPLPLTGTVKSADLLPTAMLSLRVVGGANGQRASALSDAALRKAVVGDD